MRDKKRYQLRCAAGMYWLIDMAQTGKEYQKPIVLNECGAEIWNRYQDGEDEEQIAENLHKNYEIGPDEAVKDIREFLQQLEDQGIL